MIVELEVGERHIADHGVDAPLGQPGVAEILDADVLAGVERFRDPPRDGIHFNADEAVGRFAVAHEIAGAATGFQYGGALRYAQPGDGVMDGSDDDGRRIEGVERGAFGAVVFLRRQQRFQFLTQCLPARILVGALHRIGEYREGDRAEAGKTGEHLFFLASCQALFLLDGFQRADGGDDVAGLGFLAARYGRRDGDRMVGGQLL